MKKRYIFSILLGIAAFANSAKAQMVGTQEFLQGKYVEIGLSNNGAFGACPPFPAGYNYHCPGCTMGFQMGYDWGHDGWAVGAPAAMGDYTEPGTPFEGWEIQINGVRSQAMQGGATTFSLGCPGIFVGGTLTGSNTGYSNSGGRAIGTWTGTAAGMQITQQTRVDTLASWVVVTTKFVNPGPGAANNVYYLRSTDPDNDQSWPGGAFSTTNTIMFQNNTTSHKVLVRALGGAYPAAADYLGLGTKDCRAKCFSYSGWPMPTATDLANVWTGGASFAAGIYNVGQQHVNQDNGIGLVYNLGNIAAGDSAILSYAYIFNNDGGLDSAFPDPQIVVNGIPKPSWAPTTPNFDTLDVCNTGWTSVPVEILNATDKCWSWSSWTWAPSTGLASTTGVTNTITTGSLPPVITYTITGTDSATGMTSCNTKIFYLTIHTCNGATANSPCEGDAINFNAPGDSSAATYAWSGPNSYAPVIATTQAFTKSPAAVSDSGWYYVIKTVAGIPDTSKVHVIVHPKPILSVTSNQANCGPLVVPTLSLNVTSAEPLDTYEWTGPNGFTSTLQAPTISVADSSYGGTYTVSVASIYGCTRTGTVDVHPGPIADFTAIVHPGCLGDTVIFHNLSSNANKFVWDFKHGSPYTIYTRNPDLVHVYPARGIYDVVLTTSNNWSCPPATKNFTVNTMHDVTASFSYNQDSGCFNPNFSFVLNSTSTAVNTTNPSANTAASVVAWEWNFGDGSPVDNNSTPSGHTFPNPGVYNVTLKVTDAIGCTDETEHPFHVIETKMTGIDDTTVCLVNPMPLRVVMETLNPSIVFPGNAYYTYSWAGDGVDKLDSPNSRTPMFFGYGDFTFTTTSTMMPTPPWGCIATHQTVIHSVKPKKLQNVTLESIINYGERIQLYTDGMVTYMWSPMDGSLNNNNINNPVASPTVTTTYIIYGFDENHCRDTAYVTIHVDSTSIEFLPSAFSPNGDGQNDVFRPLIGKFQHLVEFRVYNRWGQELFFSNDIRKGWDGTFNGVPQDMGVYYYQVIASKPGGSENATFKGEFTLIR